MGVGLLGYPSGFYHTGIVVGFSLTLCTTRPYQHNVYYKGNLSARNLEMAANSSAKAPRG